MTPDLTELEEALMSVAQLAHVPVRSGDISIESLPAPHRKPSSLPAGKQAVYVFFLGPHCLKVGKAGPKTQARFTSQHYGENAPSTLAKSILKEKSRLSGLLGDDLRTQIEQLNRDSIGRWIETNTSRIHIFIPTTLGAFVLGLVESFVQCRCNPMFEGKTQEVSVGT